MSFRYIDDHLGLEVDHAGGVHGDGPPDELPHVTVLHCNAKEPYMQGTPSAIFTP